MRRCVGGGKIISYQLGVLLILFIVALAELFQGKKGRKKRNNRKLRKRGAGTEINHCRGIANVF